MVSPVIPRPALDVSPSPSPRPRSALLRQGWQPSLPWSSSPEGRSLRLKHPQMWGLGLGSLALGLVNGALVISAGIGLVAYQQILQLSPRQRKGLMQRLQQGLPLPTTPQQQALMLGLVTGVSTYTFTALWHSTHSLLMALLLTGQGALALFAVGALLRSSRAAERSDDLWNAAPVAQVEHNVGLLSHPDPLKRLVAVRRLVRLAQADDEYLVGLSVRSHLLDCFQLRLGQESDAIVRSALEEGLRLLRSAKPLPPSSAAAFVVDSASDAAELKYSELDPQFVAAPDLARPPNPSELGHLEASLEQDNSYQVSGSSTEASITELTRSSSPVPKERRAVVEYEEYLDI
ncbi:MULTISPECIES: hypothetical protein [Cyanophyceae]|uniref:hypothetical protein n=1 Tax=Cyanophyceae TaxID=3028117 RepID=UPI001689EBC8|nr:MULTISPECIES: hypothetical protein [Cyanophyceae]MBD1918955.1 hypothetical protein [Phormidium sp. FACHB-77]MBD2033203.1 hypothetical protein [Phormidium sp. FACHB-322]MBD2053864.1 hypothetical protein [Leptolyngbya sp. FACHB-60]